MPDPSIVADEGLYIFTSLKRCWNFAPTIRGIKKPTGEPAGFNG